MVLLLPVANSVLAGAGSASPTLRFVTAAGYQPAIAGRGWMPGTRIVFSVQEATVAAGLEIRVTRRGTFRVGVTDVSMCDRPVFVARDLHGGLQTKLSGPPLGCASRLNPPVPQMHLLQGRLAKHRVVRVYRIQPRQVTLHVGDELYIWEAGTSQPAFRPHADPTYLTLIGQGTTPPRACAQPDCDSGFYWDYVALRTGVTLLDMSPACRDAAPPCAAPDLAMKVTILP
jgi:hypothetical protein